MLENFFQDPGRRGRGGFVFRIRLPRPTKRVHTSLRKVRALIRVLILSLVAMVLTSSARAGVPIDAFQEWSNSRPRSQVVSELKTHLDGLKSSAAMQTQLEAWGFDVESVTYLDAHTASILGLTGGRFATLVASWDTGARGRIFAYSILERIDAVLFVYGVTLEIILNERSEVQSVDLTMTRE